METPMTLRDGESRKVMELAWPHHARDASESSAAGRRALDGGPAAGLPPRARVKKRPSGIT